MQRLETHRRIESALSILVVALVLGAIGRGLAGVAQATLWWLVQSRGWTAVRVSELSFAWSWADALAAITIVGAVLGLWRLSRAFIGGRVRSLASGALWTFVGSLVLSALWQLVTPVVLHHISGPSAPGRWIFFAFSLLHHGVFVVASGLWIAALVVLARMTTEGARTAWIGRIMVAALLIALEVGWRLFGQPLLFPWPLWNALVGFVVTSVGAAGMLALLVPVRRVWRAQRDEPAATFEGPYRTLTAPEASWREAPELRIAGEGLTEVRRRVQSMMLVATLAVPVALAATASRSLVGTALAVLGLAAIQLGISFPLTAGVARYTRAPAELPGRSLAIAGLLCQTAALVSASRSMLGTVAVLAGSEEAQVTTVNTSVSAGVAALLGTVLLIVALGRAARGLGDAETRRRASTALAVYLVAHGVVVVIAIAVVRGQAPSMAALEWLIPTAWFLITVVCMATYAWLLAAAARMPGFVPLADPPPPPA